MKKTLVMVLMAGYLSTMGAVFGEVAPADEQIAAAVQAAPKGRAEEAAVLGYDASGQLVTLRKGSNDLICLADNPSDDRFSVACYHESLEPYMARGRELLAEGVTGQKRNTQRWDEAKAGKLAMPEEPATLYVLTGGGFDAAAGEVKDPFLRWVLYVPNATAESTGLPTDGSAGGPWLMFPGTEGAHIMITPPRD